MTKKSKYLNVPYSNLSAYTIAANCSDSADCEIGISELRDFFTANYPAPCKLAIKRLFALHKKVQAFKKISK